jgi:sugar O-acyltransferase (sialic acid O-acetyltransferase NeuD family)
VALRASRRSRIGSSVRAPHREAATPLERPTAVTPGQLLIVGGGGLARETLQLVTGANRGGASWDVVGIIDDNPRLASTTINGVPVLGGTDAVSDYPHAQVVLCTANSSDYASRRRFADRLRLPQHRYATLIDSAASIAATVSVGPGSLIFAGTVATADARIGAHVVVMPGTVITHDVVIEDYVTICGGVRLSGSVHVQAGAYLGTGALVREDVTIGAGALVGMGAVVLDDVPPGEVWIGIPARPMPTRMRLMPQGLPT